MGDSHDIDSMAEFPTQEFDISWLWREASLEGYFGRDERQAFIDAYAEDLPELAAAFRTQLDAERAAVEAAWRDGDELWEWRNEKWAPPFEARDAVGEIGIAVIRAGRVIAAWTTGIWGKGHHRAMQRIGRSRLRNLVADDEPMREHKRTL